MSSVFDEFVASAAPTSAVSPHPCVLGVRIRCARNLASMPFPSRASVAVRQRIFKEIVSAEISTPTFKNAFVFENEKLTPSQRDFLVECRRSAPDFRINGGGVLVSRSRDVALLINEEDHWRLQAFADGDDFDSAWRKMLRAQSELGGNLSFAFSEKYGFLTACPTNLGTGLRVSVMLHLPGFVMDGQMEKIVRALETVGLTVRGSLGEGSEPRACIFQVSNRHTLGISPEETLALVKRWTKEVVEQEIAARKRFFSRTRRDLSDRISRAYGILRNAVVLSENESLDLLSLLRLGCFYELFPREKCAVFDELFLEAGNAHITARAAFRGTPCRDDGDVQLLRARLFQETLSAVRPPVIRL